jgi:hypothetical protein
MKSSNFSSYDKVDNLSINGNYVDAYSLDKRAILINHRYLYDSVFLNFNQENLNTTIRITTVDNNTIDFTFNTKYIADGTGTGDLKKSNTAILPIQHKNIELITDPTYTFQNDTICTLYYDAGLTVSAGNPFKLLAYTEADSGGTVTCTQLEFGLQDPGDCDSDSVIDAAAYFYGYWIAFEDGTC